jgi:hypothetical protein
MILMAGNKNPLSQNLESVRAGIKADGLFGRGEVRCTKSGEEQEEDRR